jgi:lipopolysaccharide export system permease protein
MFSKAVATIVLSQIHMTLPFTVLVAVVMTYGRAASDNEINSMRAVGVHLYTALAPAILFGLAGSALVLVVNDRIAPRLRSMSKAAFLEGELVEAIQAKLDRGENAIPFGREIWLLIRDVGEDGTYHDVRFKKYDRDDEKAGPEYEFALGRARFTTDVVNDQIILEGWDVVGLAGSSAGLEFEYMRWPLKLGGDGEERKLSQYTLAELEAEASRRYDGVEKVHSIETEFHQRVSSAFACILFVLMGAPLAIIFRHGNRMVAFLIAFLIALFGYYPLFILGKVLAEEALVSPVLAAWSGSGVLLLLGAGLTAVVFRR